MSGQPSEPTDLEIENLLTASLRRPPLTATSMAAMRVMVEREWRDELARHTRARLWKWAAAASLAACALLGWWQLARTGAVFGTLQGASAGLALHRFSWLGERAVTDSVMHVGDRLEARTDTLIRLPGDTALRLRAGALLRLSAADEVELRAGTAYVDSVPTRSARGLRVRTPLGLVEHLGTQFEVALLDSHVRVRVREGAVRVGSSLRADAGEELTLDATGALQRRTLPAYDREWAWVQALPDAPDVEGRNALALLRWVARETGRQLEFADERAAQLANTAVLHGSIRGLAPDLALRAMLATTSLSADVQAERIVVRSAPPPQT